MTHALGEQDSAPRSLVDVACDLCGSDDADPILSSPDRNWPVQSRTANPSGHVVWRLVQCRRCGLIYLNPRPAPESVHQFYPSDYYAYEAAGDGTRLTWKRRVKRFVRRSRTLYRLAMLSPAARDFEDPVSKLVGWVQPGRILDVGCGAGNTLDQCAVLGWETWGVELSDQAVRAARANGHRVWNGSLEECDIPPASVDVVRMNHVLEHVPSPTQTMRAAERILRPGGRIVVEVPHLTQIFAALSRDYFWALDLPRHFYHFTADSLKRVVAESGLRVVETKTVSSPTTLLRSFDLALLDHDGVGQPWNLAQNTPLAHDRGLFASLEPFCRALEARGYGTSLALSAVKRRASAS